MMAGRTFQAFRSSVVEADGFAFASMRVHKRRLDQSWMYYSLPWVEPWKFRTYIRFRRALRDHRRDAEAGGVHRAFMETPRHPIPYYRKRRAVVPIIVAKITNDDGTESSFGPVDVTKKAAEDIAAALSPAEEKRLADVEEQRVAEAVAEQARRSAEAEAHNQRRVDRASAGLDPDGED